MSTLTRTRFEVVPQTEQIGAEIRGLDLHERPYISEEDDLALEEGMVFTIEPSINVPGRFGMRIEDMVVCETGGGRLLADRSLSRLLKDDWPRTIEELEAFRKPT